MFCTKCGKPNDDTASFCASCGYVLPLIDQSVSTPQAQVEVPASDEEYYKAVLGPKNQDYYLDHFARFDDEGRISPSWHWPAFLVTFYWMLYRKMWLNAAIYFFLPYLLVILFGMIGLVTGRISGFMTAFGYLLYLVAIFVLLPMYANAIYYRQCRKTIADVRAATQGTQRQLGELSGKGGTSNAVFIIILIIMFVAFIGILAAVAIPAYQDYTLKARTSQAAMIGVSAEKFVDEYYRQYRTMPKNLEGSDIATPLPPAVKDVSINEQTGTVTITMTGAAAIAGKTIKFVPALVGGDQLSWTCMSDEIQDRYLPLNCRQSR
jgi:Tfp pilus assembly protein PilE